MQKIKSIVLFVALSAAISINACKKEKAAPLLSTITAQVNGSATLNFNKNAIAVKGSQDTQNFTVIQGGGADGLIISMTLYGPLTAGETFTSNSQNSDNKMLFAYTTNNDGFFNDDEDVITVTITSINSTSIQGTFEGKVTDKGILSGTPIIKTISNGQFSVNY